MIDPIDSRDLDTHDQANPYAVFGQEVARPIEDMEDVEVVRRKYLKHEASIKSIGGLYLVGGMVGMVVACFHFWLAVGAQFAPADRGFFGFLAVLVGGLSLGHLFVGYGLRRLNARSRIGGIILSCIGLLNFPVGSVISLYILYLLASKNGVFVVSDEYHDIIQATPHIKYRTSIIVWFVVILLLVLVLFAVMSAVFTPVTLLRDGDGFARPKEDSRRGFLVINPPARRKADQRCLRTNNLEIPLPRPAARAVSSYHAGLLIAR